MRIAHFTDVHVMRPPAEAPLRELLSSKRGLGWLNLTLMRRAQRFHELEAVVHAFLDDWRKQAPDLTVFTGDLTAVAWPEEFAAAARLFEDLRKRRDVLGVCGNHDLYTPKAKGDEHFQKHFQAWLPNDHDPSQLGDPLEIGLRLLGDELAVITLPSARPTGLTDSSGRCGPERLARLEALLTSPELQSRHVIIALHYALMLEDGRPDKAKHGLRDASEVLELCRRFRPTLVIHGHLHERFVIPQGPMSPVAIANAGSLTDSRYARAYHIYEFSKSSLHLEVRRYDPESRRFVVWPDAPGSGHILNFDEATQSRS